MNDENIDKINKINQIKLYLAGIKIPFKEKEELPAHEKDKTWIYILSDPTDISITCYVGKAEDARDRYDRHLWPSELINNGSKERYLHNWVISLLKRGIEPKMTILEQVPTLEFGEAERFFIAYYKYIGMDLCNLTEGGEGAPGYKHTEQGLEKMRQAKLGIPMTEEMKIKRMRQDLLKDIELIKSFYLEGYSLIEVGELYNTDHDTIKFHLQRAGVKLREEKYNDRYKTKLREAQTGKILTEETKEKIKDAHTGATRTLETRRKISTTRKEQIALGNITMPTNKASGENAGKYRDDVSDDLLIKYYQDGLSLREIGRCVNLEHHSVKDRLIKAGIKFETNAKKNTTNFIFDLPRALELYKAGKSCNAIGKEIGCDSKIVKKYLEKSGIVFGKASNSHKALNDKIDRIKELYERNFTFAEIGRMFNTSGNTIKAHLKKYNIID